MSREIFFPSVFEEKKKNTGAPWKGECIFQRHLLMMFCSVFCMVIIPSNMALLCLCNHGFVFVFFPPSQKQCMADFIQEYVQDWSDICHQQFDYGRSIMASQLTGHHTHSHWPLDWCFSH